MVFLQLSASLFVICWNACDDKSRVYQWLLSNSFTCFIIRDKTIIIPTTSSYYVCVKYTT